MANKKRKSLEPWLSAKPGGDNELRFIRVGDSLLFHPSWQKLSDGAKNLYLCASMESAGKRYFSFPALTMGKYGIARPSGQRWIRELVKAGFIRLTYCGKSQMKPNEYEFINDWKTRPDAPLFDFRPTESPGK